MTDRDTRAGKGGNVPSDVVPQRPVVRDEASHSETPVRPALPTVTVIVPVFNDLDRLRTCLTSIEDQDYPSGLVDVVVVDNASTQDLRGALPDDPRFVMITERKKGSYAARNAGVARARGKVLAFTDADCLPRRDWLSNAVARLRTEPGAAVGGRIALMFQDGSRATTGPELYEELNDFLQQKYVETWSFAATANLVVSAETFQAVGMFDSDLKSGGDLDWGTRLAAHGGLVVYSHDAVVDHPSRPTWRDLGVKSLRVANGLADRSTSRRELLRMAVRQSRSGVSIWWRVRHENLPARAGTRVRYAAAFSYVRFLRVGVYLTRFARFRDSEPGT